MSANMKEIESKLTAQQKKAAYLLVENELRENPSKRAMSDIADEVGVCYKTVWEWRTKNKNFIAFKNSIADDFLAEKRDQVYSQLMKLINAKQPSVKAMDLFLRRFGLLTDRHVTEEVNSGDNRDNKKIEDEIDELDILLKGE